MIVRLQKAIREAGIASRRGAEKLIEDGLVKVNGQTVDKMGMIVDTEKDHIFVEGKRLNFESKKDTAVFALYKPKSCVCTMSDPQGRATVSDFFPSQRGLFPVGRLDYDAEGLILITNDGDIAQQISHPSKHVWKKYFVKIKGIFDKKYFSEMNKGPVIDGKKRQPVKSKIIHTVNDKTWMEVSLQEGVNRHIKKMFKGFGYQVQKIKRYSIGNIELGDLTPGEFRKLKKEEIDELLTMVSSDNNSKK